jgi:hypothetical protein
MLWSREKIYQVEPFDQEKDLELGLQEVKKALFGEERIYLETKRKIGARGGIRNIPDAYLIDLTSIKEPTLYVVENELAKHDPLKHIAVQILEFSLSFETTPQKVKEIVKAALADDKPGWAKCEAYAQEYGFENVDYLLERMIYSRRAFNALVIIDEVPDELETILVSKFQFPVEVLAFQRFKSPDGERIYQFEPFLYDVGEPVTADEKKWTGIGYTLDPSEIDTIVVPARDDGFEETFIGEDCWYKIRMHSSMIPKIKWIAAYRVAPISAITHIAPVRDIEPYKDTNKYILYFAEPAKKIGPIKLKANGDVKAPQAPRYTSMERLLNAKTMDEAF